MANAAATAETSAKLLDVQGVADFLNCSPRHVYRMADAGRMPAPLRLGSLVRWDRAAIENWIAGGCQPVRQAGKIRRDAAFANGQNGQVTHQ